MEVGEQLEEKGEKLVEDLDTEKHVGVARLDGVMGIERRQTAAAHKPGVELQRVC